MLSRKKKEIGDINMVQIFIIFLIIILMLGAIIGAAVGLRSHRTRDLPDDFDEQYYNEEGNHIYYDRSRIEKEEFIRKHPGEKPRSLSRLFSRRRN